MAIFKDSKDREWDIELDAPLIVAVRLAADPDFLKGDAIDTIDRLREDLVMLCTVVRTLCKKQADSRGVSEADFYQGVIGDAIDHATEALLNAIVNFTPSHARETLKACAAKNAKARELAMTKVLKMIEDPATMEQVEKMLDAELEAQMRRLLTQRSSPLN